MGDEAAVVTLQGKRELAKADKSRRLSDIFKFKRKTTTSCRAGSTKLHSPSTSEPLANYIHQLTVTSSIPRMGLTYICHLPPGKFANQATIPTHASNRFNLQHGAKACPVPST